MTDHFDETTAMLVRKIDADWSFDGQRPEEWGMEDAHRRISTALRRVEADTIKRCTGIIGDMPILVRAGHDAHAAVSAARADIIDALEARLEKGHD